MNLRRRQQPAPQGQQTVKGVTRPPLVTTQQETPPPVNPTRTETPEPRSYGEQLRRQADALRKQVRDLLDANAELWDAVRTRDGRIVRLEGEKAAATARIAELERFDQEQVCRIIDLEDARRGLTGDLEVAERRVTALEAEVGQRKETARSLALAALAVEEKHRAQLAAKNALIESRNQQIERLIDHPGLAGLIRQAGRPESTDPEPTGPLATFAAEQLARQQQQTGWGFIVAEPAGDPADQTTVWAPGGPWQPRSSAGQSAPMVGE